MDLSALPWGLAVLALAAIVAAGLLGVPAWAAQLLAALRVPLLRRVLRLPPGAKAEPQPLLDEGGPQPPGAPGPTAEERDARGDEAGGGPAGGAG